MNYQRTAVISSFLVATLLAPVIAEAQWGPYYPGYPGYPGYYRYAGPESDLKFDVTPKTASVYVDGYFAGQVDDYDGAFGRLHVAPGEHEIVVYLDGYRSLRQRLYLSPNRTRRIQGRLEKLAAGEAAESVPVPDERAQTLGPVGEGDDADFPPRQAPGQRAPRPLDRQPQTAPDSRTSGLRTSTSAALSIRVQPGGATVIIDGESWQGPSSSSERLIVQVAEGHHTVEVRRDGYERFTTEIDVRGGQTAPVNISLTKQ